MTEAVPEATFEVPPLSGYLREDEMFVPETAREQFLMARLARARWSVIHGEEAEERDRLRSAVESAIETVAALVYTPEGVEVWKRSAPNHLLDQWADIARKHHG